MAKTANIVKTIRLGEGEIREILDKLEDATPQEMLDRRRAPRYRYSAKSCVIHLVPQGGGAPTSYLVSTRDISDSGIGFLHGAFIYPGAKVVVQLITLHGTWQNVPATVARCDYVSSGVHDVGVRFIEPIDASEFCTEAAPCRVLVVDDNRAIIEFTRVLLTSMNADVDQASNGDAAIQLALSSVYDVILMDMDMPGMSGFETVAKLRSHGYTGNVVAVTGMTQPGDEARCLEAGCNSYLPKPLTREQLGELLRSLRQEPLHSSLAQDRAMIPHIDNFVSQLPVRVRSLETAFVSGDKKSLQSACRNLKGESGTFGFEPIQIAAEELENAIVAGTALSDVELDFKSLVRLCSQARSSAHMIDHCGEDGDEEARGSDDDAEVDVEVAESASEDDVVDVCDPSVAAAELSGRQGTSPRPNA